MFRKFTLLAINIIILCLAVLLGLAGTGLAEQAARIRIVNDRWPDASSMERFAADAIRIMDARTEEEKALALFRFIRMFTARTDGNVPREPALGDTYIDDPLKILNVYGAHHCDGLTRVMELAWRSLGRRAGKLYRSGHTQANVHWLDEDGVARWHLFDMSEGWYVYDRSGRHIAGPNDIALDYSLIFRPSGGPIPDRKNYWGMWNWIHAPHLPWPEHDTSLHLRAGERLTLHWDNMGRPYQDNFAAKGKKDLEHGPYPVTFGNGLLEYTPDLEKPGLFAAAANLAILPGDAGQPALHPASPGKHSEAILRIASPHIITDAWFDGSFWRGSRQDELGAAISTDGGTTWQDVWQASDIGRLHVRNQPLSTGFDISRPVPKNLISPFGRYDYLFRVRMTAARDADDVGIDALTISTVTQHNIFALPMFWPGTNGMTVSGDIPDAISLRVAFTWDDLAGQERRSEVLVTHAPFQYDILTSGRRWQDVRGRSLTIEAVPRTATSNQVIARASRPGVLEEIGPAQAFAFNTIVGSTLPPPLKTVSAYIADLADPRKQVEALSGLMVLRDPAALDAVQQVALRSISHPQKDMAIQGLHLIAPEQSRPVLLEILAGSPRVNWKHDPENKLVQLGHWHNIAALIGLQMAESEEAAAVPLLMAVLESAKDHPETSWQPHASIIRSLGRLGDPAAAPLIRRFLEGNLDVVAAAARALGALGDKAAMPRLRELFRTSDYPMITLYSGEALIRLGDRDIVPDLHALLQSADENLRALAAAGLRGLGGPEDMAVLEKFLAAEKVMWVKRAVGADTGQDPCH